MARKTTCLREMAYTPDLNVKDINMDPLLVLHSMPKFTNGKENYEI